MRIGHAIFYNLECARQTYHSALEYYPVFTGMLSLAFFVGFALKTPLHKKLFKETGYSVCLGALFGYIPVYFSYQKYLTVVDESYAIVKQKFDMNPKLIEKVENEDNSSVHIKNFGLSIWNDHDTMDDFDMDAQKLDPFKGTGEDEAKEVRDKIRDRYYGE